MAILHVRPSQQCLKPGRPIAICPRLSISPLQQTLYSALLRTWNSGIYYQSVNAIRGMEAGAQSSLLTCVSRYLFIPVDESVLFSIWCKSGGMHEYPTPPVHI